MRRPPALLLSAAFWGCLATIAVLGWKPAPPEQLFNAADKLYHALAFLVLTLLARLAYPTMSWRWLAVLVLGAGVMLEWGQLLAPQRTPSVADMLANAAGLLLGLAVLRIARRPFAPLR